MKKIKLTTIALLLLISVVKAQETKDTTKFIPSGKPAVRIYTNAHTTYQDGENKSAFEIQRAYFGYKYDFSENFSSKIILDVGDPGTGKLQMTAYLKSASLTYKKKKLTAEIGMISLYHFRMQEKQWGYRYIYKSFEDENKFGSSADLGASASYKFSDFISVDAMIINGEGYKVVQLDNTYKGAVGVTITPIKNLNIRGYYDLMSKSVAQQTITFYAGYKAKKFRIGGEYNSQKNHILVDGHDLSGISAYGAVVLNKKFNVFGRIDHLTQEKPNDESTIIHNPKDGQVYIVGFEYKPVKGVKIAPNFQGFSPSDNDAGFKSSYYLNIQIDI